MAIEKHIPNLMTLGNLFCGFFGLLFCFDVYRMYSTGLAGAETEVLISERLSMASMMIFAGAFFDVLDGMLARALKVHSPIGKELDSLADVVTFGVLPAAIVHNLLLHAHGAEWLFGMVFLGVPFISLIPFVIVACAALRLAKFNVDETQRNHFKGLPSPANALFFASLPLILRHDTYFLFNMDVIALGPWLLNAYVLIGLSILLGWLMVSNIPLMSFKFKSMGWAENKIVYAFLILDAALFVMLSWAALPLIILLYIILSLIKYRKHDEIQSAD